MNRDIQKAINTHRSYIKKWGGAGDFYPSDVMQIIQGATRKDGQLDHIDAIFNALYAGFTIGYRTAKREAKKRGGYNEK